MKQFYTFLIIISILLGCVLGCSLINRKDNSGNRRLDIDEADKNEAVAPQFEVARFQYWSGNESLPPQYQHVTIIQGTINPENITVSYESRDNKGTIRQNFELKGEEYKKCLEMIRSTKLKKKELMAGASSSDVTLSGKNGEQEMGEPSNSDEWSKFVTEIVGKVKSKQ